MSFVNETTVQEEALRFGRFVSQTDAKEILWEYTGWPVLCRPGLGEQICRAQIEEYFRAAIDGDAVDRDAAWRLVREGVS